MESTGRIGEALRFFEHTPCGERWSSTKSLQFQSDAGARIRNLLFALFTTKIYQQDSPQPSTCCGAVMPPPAICMHARAGMGAPKFLIFPSLAGCPLPAILSATSEDDLKRSGQRRRQT